MSYNQTQESLLRNNFGGVELRYNYNLNTEKKDNFKNAYQDNSDKF